MNLNNMTMELHFSNVPDMTTEEAKATFNDFIASFDAKFNVTGTLTITPQLEGEDES
jgi:hypothetical protein